MNDQVSDASEAGAIGEHHQELAAIYRVSQQLQKPTTPEILARDVIGILEDTLGYENCAVLLLDKGSGHLTLFAMSENSSRSNQAFEEPDGEHQLRLGVGITGWVAQTGRAVLLGDVSQDPRYYAARDGIGSELCVPMQAGGRVIGVVNVESVRPNAYSELDKQVLETVASQIAIAVQNAYLFSRFQQYATEHEKRVARRSAELEEVIVQLRREIAERQRTESAQRESEEKYRLLFETMVQGIVYFDASGSIVSANPAAAEILGLSLDELHERKLEDLNWKVLERGDADGSKSIHPALRALGDGAEVKNVVVAFHRPGTLEERWILVNAVPQFRPGERKPFQVYTTFDDITDRETVDQALQHQNEELAQLNAVLLAQNEELDAYGRTVAHDLKNPLAILLGFARVLGQDYIGGDDEILSQGIQVILENGLRLENIIDELLLLAEVRQLEEIRMEPLDMEVIIEETTKRLSNVIEEHEATITAPSAWPIALGHQPWVEEIWFNYVGNAIKYGGRPARVELGAMVQSDGMARYWVRDNGLGIAPDDQKRLFAPFTKLYQVRAKGHGLGLSIVQRIATKLGGSVGVQSEPGRGSLFWFTLPLANELEKEKITEQSPGLDQGASG